MPAVVNVRGIQHYWTSGKDGFILYRNGAQKPVARVRSFTSYSSDSPVIAGAAMLDDSACPVRRIVVLREGFQTRAKVDGRELDDLSLMLLDGLADSVHMLTVFSFLLNHILRGLPIPTYWDRFATIYGTEDDWVAALHVQPELPYIAAQSYAGRIVAPLDFFQSGREYIKLPDINFERRSDAVRLCVELPAEVWRAAKSKDDRLVSEWASAVLRQSIFD